MRINVFNRYNKLSVDKKIVAHLVKKILKKERYKLGTLNIIITDNNYLKKLNKMFFKKNRTTNVISFNMEEVSEIYISGAKAKGNKEIYYYIIHGLLHIIGYHHRNQKENALMKNKCLKYLSAL